MLEMCLVEFSQFFRGGEMCLGNRNEWKPGDTTKMCVLSKTLYIYFEIKVFKAQMGYGGTQICKIKQILKDFKHYISS